MTKYYSQSTSGFYSPEINAFIPDDAVEITEEAYHDFLMGQSSGKQISKDKKGFPVLVDHPVMPAILGCSPYQFRSALGKLGIRDQVEKAVASSDQDLKDAYAYATCFLSNNAKVLALAKQLGQSEKDIANLFQTAVTLAP